MPLGRDGIIDKDGKSFGQFASTLCDKTTIIHIMADWIDRCKLEDPFADSVPNNRYYLNACDKFQ